MKGRRKKEKRRRTYTEVMFHPKVMYWLVAIL